MLLGPTDPLLRGSVLLVVASVGTTASNVGASIDALVSISTAALAAFVFCVAVTSAFPRSIYAAVPLIGLASALVHFTQLSPTFKRFSLGSVVLILFPWGRRLPEADDALNLAAHVTLSQLLGAGIGVVASALPLWWPTWEGAEGSKSGVLWSSVPVTARAQASARIRSLAFAARCQLAAVTLAFTHASDAAVPSAPRPSALSTGPAPAKRPAPLVFTPATRFLNGHDGTSPEATESPSLAPTVEAVTPFPDGAPAALPVLAITTSPIPASGTVSSAAAAAGSGSRRASGGGTRTPLVRADLEDLREASARGLRRLSDALAASAYEPREIVGKLTGGHRASFSAAAHAWADSLRNLHRLSGIMASAEKAVGASQLHARFLSHMSEPLCELASVAGDLVVEGARAATAAAGHGEQTARSLAESRARMHGSLTRFYAAYTKSRVETFYRTARHSQLGAESPNVSPRGADDGDTGEGEAANRVPTSTGARHSRRRSMSDTALFEVAAAANGDEHARHASLAFFASADGASSSAVVEERRRRNWGLPWRGRATQPTAATFLAKHVDFDGTAAAGDPLVFRQAAQEDDAYRLIGAAQPLRSSSSLPPSSWRAEEVVAIHAFIFATLRSVHFILAAVDASEGLSNVISRQSGATETGLAMLSDADMGVEEPVADAPGSNLESRPMGLSPQPDLMPSASTAAASTSVTAFDGRAPSASSRAASLFAMLLGLAMTALGCRRLNVVYRMQRAVRVTVAVVVAAIVSLSLVEHLQIEFAQWAALTVAFIAGGTEGGAFRTSMLRLMGTLAGSSFGFVVIRLAKTATGTSLAAVGVVVTLWIGLLCYPRASPQTAYISTVAAFSGAIVMLGAGNKAAISPLVAVERIEEMLWGAAIFVVVSSLLWPLTARTLVRARMLEAVTALRDAQDLAIDSLRDLLRRHDSAHVAQANSAAGATPSMDPAPLLTRIDAILSGLPELLMESAAEPALWRSPPASILHSRYTDTSGALARGVKAVRLLRQCTLALQAEERLLSQGSSQR